MAPSQSPRGEAATMSRAGKRPIAAPLALVALLAIFAAAVLPAIAQQAKLTVDDDCTVFAFSPNGDRIVYATRHISEQRVARDKKMLVETDDIWQVTVDGHKKRLVDGKKLVKSPVPVSFQIQAIRIAPDDRHMTVQMITKTLVPNPAGGSSGNVQSGQLTDLMDGEGKEINIEGTNPKNSAIFGATNAAWLADGQTVVYLTQPKDSLLYKIAYVRPEGGTSGAILPDNYFAAVAWNPAHNAGVAIERDKDLGGPIRLVWIDLIHKTERTLATLAGYNGQLTFSPSGKQVAYFRDGDTMEIRSIADPEKVTSIKLPFGRYEWSADDTHLMLKRGPADQTDQLLWITLPGGTFEYAFHGLIYHNFHVSPDGRWVAVTEPGKQILKLFPTP
jgi:hypothetical protein